jgi:hypothetical protein
MRAGEAFLDVQSISAINQNASDAIRARAADVQSIRARHSAPVHMGSAAPGTEVIGVQPVSGFS